MAYYSWFKKWQKNMQQTLSLDLKYVSDVFKSFNIHLDLGPNLFVLFVFKSVSLSF